MVKLLWYDGQGLCLFSKRLERGRFVWPVTETGRVSLTPAGRAKLEWARRRRTERLAQRLSTLSTDDVRRLMDALPVLELLADDD